MPQYRQASGCRTIAEDKITSRILKARSEDVEVSEEAAELEEGTGFESEDDVSGAQEEGEDEKEEEEPRSGETEVVQTVSVGCETRLCKVVEEGGRRISEEAATVVDEGDGDCEVEGGEEEAGKEEGIAATTASSFRTRTWAIERDSDDEEEERVAAVEGGEIIWDEEGQGDKEWGREPTEEDKPDAGEAEEEEEDEKDEVLLLAASF